MGDKICPSVTGLAVVVVGADVALEALAVEPLVGLLVVAADVADDARAVEALLAAGGLLLPAVDMGRGVVPLLVVAKGVELAM